MPSTEELRIYLRTIADTTGAKETQAALRQTQQSAKSLTAAGIAGGLAAAGANALANSLGNVVNAYGSSINVAREHERIVRATSMAYGQAAKDYADFAQQLSAQTGFTSDAILEAALSARTLSQNYGLSIQQTQKLISASADLARVRGIGVFEAFERVQAAIRGEGEAAEYLGLTINDTYLKNQAMNGSLKNTYETLTDVEKAQIRYNEVLRQSAQFSGLAAKSADSLDGAFTRAEKSVRLLQQAFGAFSKGPTVAGLGVLSQVADALKETFEGTDLDRRARAFVETLGKGLLGGGALVPTFQQASEAAAEEQLRRRREMVIKVADEQERLNRAEMASASVGLKTTAEAAARVAFMDQVEAAVRDAAAAQRTQLELQQRGVDLAAEEARIRLGMLPAQQRLTELQRQMTEQQIKARQAAMPAQEALEDMQFAQQRAQLIAANRNVGVEQRIAARRELRGIGRALPGAELAALEAGRGVTLAGRAAERLGMEQQLFEISTQRQLEQITLAQTQTGLLSQIAAQRTQAIELTINLGTEEFQTEVFKQLVEAEKQAQGPTVVKLSGVRR